MDFLTHYWQQLTAFVMLVVILTRMRVDIDVLKDKVKTIFELWNKEKGYAGNSSVVNKNHIDRSYA